MFDRFFRQRSSGTGQQPKPAQPSAVQCSANELISLRLQSLPLKISRRPASRLLAGNHVSRFKGRGMDYLESRYRHRAATLAELFPWDDPNYGIDEQWAVFYPYGVKTSSGKTVSLQLKVENHSPVRRTFRVTPRTGDGIALNSEASTLTLESRATGSVQVDLEVAAPPGVQIVTADIESEGMQFREWVEAMVTIQP